MSKPYFHEQIKSTKVKNDGDGNYVITCILELGKTHSVFSKDDIITLRDQINDALDEDEDEEGGIR